MYSRRDFLKKTGLALGGLVLGNSFRAKIVKGSSYKDVTDEISKVSQEEFTSAYWRKPIELIEDHPKVLFSADKEEDSTLVKLYPINDENVPLSVIFDRYDRGFGFHVSPYLDISSVSARQTGSDSVKLKINLLESPLNLTEKFKEKIMNSNDSLMYSWRIDTDRNNKTGESKVGRNFEKAMDYMTEFYIGSEYNVKLKGNGEEWESFLENVSEGEKSPLNNFKINGNEVELTLNLEDIGSPKSFNFGGWTRSPSTSTEIGEGNLFEDMCPPRIYGETNFFGGPTPSTDKFEPGTFNFDPEYDGDGSEVIAKIFRLPSPTEEVRFKYKEGTEKVEVPITIIMDTKDSEFFLDYHEGDVRIRKEV